MLAAAAWRLVQCALLVAALAGAGCAHGPREADEPTASENPDLAGSARVFEAARQRGVDFRAVGQEPGWVLEIADGDSIRFAYDYGRSEVVVAPFPVPDRRTGRTTYDATAGSQRLQVVIERTPCADTMSGEAFEARVEVTLDGERFTGCGRWLGD